MIQDNVSCFWQKTLLFELWWKLLFLVRVIDLSICLYDSGRKYGKHQSIKGTWSYSELFFSKKEHEFSNRQRKIPTIEGDRQEVETTVFSKISNKSTENRKQEHEDLIIVLNIQRTKGSPPPSSSTPISKAQPRPNGNGNGRSCEWYNKLHIDQQW